MHDYPKVHELECLHGVTWSELVALEPELNRLLWEARRAGATCRKWSNVALAFAPFRNALTELVGFSVPQRRHPVLGSMGAYEVAYWKLYDAIVALVPPPDRGAAGKKGPLPGRRPHAMAARESLREMTNLNLR
jgi:hypothetical protein